MKVSIVTPTFNMGDRLPRCVASVASQTYPLVEQIVVDGASTDGTVEYLSGQPHLRWVSEPDSGQSDALNKGFHLATGDVLTWLNADDTLVPEATEVAVALMRRHPTVGLVYGDIELVGERSRRVARPPPTVDLASFRRGNVISQPGTFFTAEAYHKVGGIDENFHLTMDFELWLRMLMHGVEARYVPRLMARFEVHPHSKTGSQGALAFAQEEARAFSKHGLHHQAAMSIDRWYWDDTLRRIIDALVDGDHASARRLAADALPGLHPVLTRSRAFLWATRLAPSVARQLVRLKRHPTL